MIGNSIAGLLGVGAAAATSSFESIATVTAAGGETTFTFSSISSSYKHLQLRILSRRDTGVNGLVTLRLNGDTASNYWWHMLTGDGSTATASAANAASNLIRCFWTNPSVNLAGQYGAGIIDIVDYASTTKNKTVRSFGGGDANGTGLGGLASGLWSSTSAVTSVTIFFSGDAVAAGSTFALYGIKGA